MTATFLITSAIIEIETIRRCEQLIFGSLPMHSSFLELERVKRSYPLYCILSLISSM